MGSRTETKIDVAPPSASKPEVAGSDQPLDSSDLLILAVDELIRANRSMLNLISPPRDGEASDCVKFDAKAAKARFLHAIYNCQYLASPHPATSKGKSLKWTLKGRERFYFLGTEENPIWRADSNFDLKAEEPSNARLVLDTRVARTLLVQRESQSQTPMTWPYFFELLSIEGNESDTSQRYLRFEVEEGAGGVWFAVGKSKGKPVLALDDGMQLQISYRENNRDSSSKQERVTIKLETSGTVIFSESLSDSLGKSRRCNRPIGKFNWSMIRGNERKRGSFYTDENGVTLDSKTRPWTPCPAGASATHLRG